MDGRKPAGKTPVLDLVGALENVDRFHRVEGNVNGIAAGHRINRFGGIHQQRSLVLNGALDGEPAIRGANYTRNHRQRGFELLHNEGQGFDLLVAKGRGRSRRLRCGLGGLGGDFHLLVDHNLVRKLDLEGYGFFVFDNLGCPSWRPVRNPPRHRSPGRFLELAR